MKFSKKSVCLHIESKVKKAAYLGPMYILNAKFYILFPSNLSLKYSSHRAKVKSHTQIKKYCWHNFLLIENAKLGI